MTQQINEKTNPLRQGIFLLLTAVIGAVLNRIRGSDFTGDKTWQKAMAKINRFLQPVVFGGLHYYVSKDWQLGVFAALAMFIGQMPGWGAYIGAIFETHKPHAEQAWIDRMWRWLEPYPVTWGIACLSTRGVFWGMVLAAIVQTPWTLLAGVLMGPVYRITFLVAKYARLKVDVWGISEVIFGTILWVLSFV